MVSPCGDDFFVGATFGRPHGLYKFKPCRFQKRAVEGASPYKYSGKFVVPQNRYALCGFTFAQGEGGRCRFCTPIWGLFDIWLSCAFYTLICTLSAYAE